MGQKVNPTSLRLGIIKGWDSNWYGGKSFSENIVEDHNIRKYLLARITKGGIAKVVIERTLKRITLTIHTARPGVVIGKGGSEVDKLKEELKKQGFTKIKGRIQTGVIAGRYSVNIYCRFKYTRLSNSTTGYVGNSSRIWMGNFESYADNRWDRHRNIVESQESTLVAGEAYKVEGQFWRSGGAYTYHMFYGPGTTSVDWPPLVMEIFAGRDDDGGGGGGEV